MNDSKLYDFDLFQLNDLEKIGLSSKQVIKFSLFVSE